MATSEHPLSPLLPIYLSSAQGPAQSSCRNESMYHSYKRKAALCLMGFGLVLLVFYVSGFASRSEPLADDHQETLSADYSLKFLVIGDWGRHGLYNQSLVAEQMGKVGEELGIKFVVSVGDNFYNAGLTGVNDSAFTSSFTDIYTASSLQTEWYAILGNHDYRGDVLAQLSGELVQRDWRWYCQRQYKLSFPLCDGVEAKKLGMCNVTVDMFFFDTTPFIDSYWSNSSTHYDWRGLAPREEQLRYQLEDLAMNLQASNATWKVVFGHHTIRSVGYHGDMPELIEQLLPVLEKYEVDMYINGHDHILQHIKREDSPIHFFTSGGGSKSYKGLRSYGDDAGVQFVRDGQGFVSVSMSAISTSFVFYNVDGDVVYSYTSSL